MNRRRAGFTLVELVVVLALIAIAMALVVIRFDLGSRRQALISDARKLGSTIQTYREKAMLGEQTYALLLNHADGTLETNRVDDRSSEALTHASVERKFALLPQNKIDQVIVGGVQQQSQPVVIYLDCRGLLTAEIHLKVDDGQMIVVRPDPIANEVSYSDP